MAITPAFKEAVLSNNILKIRIMLKDSLLVDTSFQQFDEMLNFVESNNILIWDEEDNEVLEDKDDVNILLVELVNDFTKKRVDYTKQIIKAKYPPKLLPQEKSKNVNVKHVIVTSNPIFKGNYNIIKKKRNEIRDITKKIHDRDGKTYYEDIEDIRRLANEMVKSCDRILSMKQGGDNYGDK